MAEQTKIEWADHTFNPWEGCQRVAPECDQCYAEKRDQRFSGGIHWGPKAPRRRTSAENWNKPRRWNAQAEAFHATYGRRQRVFCASLADVFDNAVDTGWRDDLWALIRECDQMDWLLLTKRPQNIAKMLPPDWGDGWPHVWLGASAGTQKTANQNIPYLLAAPAAVRFVSAEPMLGPLDLRELQGGWYFTNCLEGFHYHDTDRAAPSQKCQRLNWVICGGESGPNARPIHPDWARDLRDQCTAAGVAFFFKQWGEWLPLGQGGFTAWQAACGANYNMRDKRNPYSIGVCSFNDGRGGPETGRIGPVRTNHSLLTPGKFSATTVARVGKKAAGRLLDGREWNEAPNAET